MMRAVVVDETCHFLSRSIKDDKIETYISLNS
jgi:hypothetical protein